MKDIKLSKVFARFKKCENYAENIFRNSWDWLQGTDTVWSYCQQSLLPRCFKETEDNMWPKQPELRRNQD